MVVQTVGDVKSRDFKPFLRLICKYRIFENMHCGQNTEKNQTKIFPMSISIIPELVVFHGCLCA